MSKILVTGTTGQLGYELMRGLQGLGELKGLIRTDADFSEPESLRVIIQKYRPDIIINPAAYTAVDKAEDEEMLAYTVNAVAPRTLAEEASKIGALLIHYSTDYVFDGQQTRPYREDDKTHPVNAYGRTKLAGEQAIQNIGGDYLILRTAWVYSRRGHNFLNSMIRLIQEKEELGIVNDQTGTPTSAAFLAEATARIVKKIVIERQNGDFQSAVYHLTAAGKATWYEFACAIKKCLEIQNPSQKLAELNSIMTDEYPTPARRAKYSVLDCSTVEKKYALSIPEWQTILAL